MNSLPTPAFNRPSRSLLLTTFLAVGLLFTTGSLRADPSVNLGTAAGFTILAGSKVTDVAASTTITGGHVGLTPTTGAALGLAATQVFGGTIYTVDAAGPTGSIPNPALLSAALNDLTAAYNDAAARPVTFDFGVTDNALGGQTLFPGVYRFGHAATANLIGTLTLDANGVENPVWIFQATSDLVTAAGSAESAGSRVVLINGADACDVFWQVGTSATIGTYADFAGHLLADQSITLGAYASLEGSALARIAAVTLDHNTITAANCSVDTGTSPAGVPDSTSTLFLLGGTAGLLLGVRRTRSES